MLCFGFNLRAGLLRATFILAFLLDSELELQNGVAEEAQWSVQQLDLLKALHLAMGFPTKT